IGSVAYDPDLNPATGGYIPQYLDTIDSEVPDYDDQTNPDTIYPALKPSPPASYASSSSASAHSSSASGYASPAAGYSSSSASGYVAPVTSTCFASTLTVYSTSTVYASNPAPTTYESSSNMNYAPQPSVYIAPSYSTVAPSSAYSAPASSYSSSSQGCANPIATVTHYQVETKAPESEEPNSAESSASCGSASSKSPKDVVLHLSATLHVTAVPGADEPEYEPTSASTYGSSSAQPYGSSSAPASSSKPAGYRMMNYFIVGNTPFTAAADEVIEEESDDEHTVYSTVERASAMP
ncbi:hypothetical protein GGF38_005944, partial [Coemansia sp. RSA 25]